MTSVAISTFSTRKEIMLEFLHSLQIVDMPPFNPVTTGYYAKMLDMFITSYPDQCSTEVLPPLGTSKHSLIFAAVDAKLKTSSDVLFHRTIYCHHKDVFGIASDPSLQKQLSSKAGFEE